MTPTRRYKIKNNKTKKNKNKNKRNKNKNKVNRIVEDPEVEPMSEDVVLDANVENLKIEDAAENILEQETVGA